MSNVYRLATDFSVFKEIPLDAEDIAEQLDADDHVLNFMYMGVKDQAVKPYWGHVSTIFESAPAFPEAAKIPSISVWSGSCLVFSEKAFAVFRRMLESYGEFLPIDVSGFTYYIFNNLMEVEPDLSKSYYSDPDSQQVGALHFGSEAHCKLLFRSRWEGCTASFCNDQFKSLCEEYEIDGLSFEEKLTGSLF